MEWFGFSRVTAIQPRRMVAVLSMVYGQEFSMVTRIKHRFTDR